MKLKIIAIAAAVVLSSLFNARAEDIKSEELIATAHVTDIYKFQNVSSEFRDSQTKLTGEFIEIFTNKNSSNFGQCVAAYYLGELHSAEAVGTLNSNIALRLDVSRIPINHLVEIDNSLRNPVVEALIKIGNPSIPAVIRNLAESDDVQVRKLSLQVLYRIDGDKDISQLRLQKALKAETDLQKQARLQAAIKALAELK